MSLVKRLYGIFEAKDRPEKLPDYREVDYNKLGGLFDKFAQTKLQFIQMVKSVADRAFGANWSAMIDTAYGEGKTKFLLDALWDNFWSPHEAINEVGHYFDVAQRQVYPDEHDPTIHGATGDAEVDSYPMSTQRLVRGDWDDEREDWFPRTERPMSVDYWNDSGYRGIGRAQDDDY